MTYRSPDWQLSAACVGIDPESWFPEMGGSSSVAKKVCAACDVRTACLEYALTEGLRFGVWGGVSAHQRRRMSRALSTEKAAT